MQGSLIRPIALALLITGAPSTRAAAQDYRFESGWGNVLTVTAQADAASTTSESGLGGQGKLNYLIDRQYYFDGSLSAYSLSNSDRSTTLSSEFFRAGWGLYWTDGQDDSINAGVGYSGALVKDTGGVYSGSAQFNGGRIHVGGDIGQSHIHLIADVAGVLMDRLRGAEIDAGIRFDTYDIGWLAEYRHTFYAGTGTSALPNIGELLMGIELRLD